MNVTVPSLYVGELHVGWKIGAVCPCRRGAYKAGGEAHVPPRT
jgi:hypothetical protein